MVLPSIESILCAQPKRKGCGAPWRMEQELLEAIADNRQQIADLKQLVGEDASEAQQVAAMEPRWADAALPSLASRSLIACNFFSAY